MTDVNDPFELGSGRTDETSTRARSAWADELACATETAVMAGAILMDRYERLERIDHKSARDVVTEADHLSEELVIAAIRERFPGDAILAEESGAHAAGGSRPANGRTWVIDPLDGTVNYANGLPVFCVSIGFVVDGRPVAGAVVDPTRAETFAATVDGPATLNGRPIRASIKPNLSDHVISLALDGRSVASRAQAIRRQVRISRSMGSAALALAYVANGRFDAFVQQSGLSAWDIAAAGLIAERGGAVVTAFDGAAWYDPARASRAAGIVAAPITHHERLLALAAGRG
ncbi:MAG: inositol monophosphatase family protein [Candidatus Limnocylindrales bacterium]